MWCDCGFQCHIIITSNHIQSHPVLTNASLTAEVPMDMSMNATKYLLSLSLLLLRGWGGFAQHLNSYRLVWELGFRFLGFTSTLQVIWVVKHFLQNSSLTDQRLFSALHNFRNNTWKLLLNLEKILFLPLLLSNIDLIPISFHFIQTCFAYNIQNLRLNSFGVHVK